MGISLEELQLAARNHGMPLEALRYDVTPVGLHYLLIHYDIPEVDADASVQELLRHDLAGGTLRLFRHEAGVRTGEDPEAVHQARVATRRVRSTLRTSSPGGTSRRRSAPTRPSASGSRCGSRAGACRSER